MLNESAVSADMRSWRIAALRIPTERGSNATQDVAITLTALLADAFAFYLKTKNFHWHLSGQYFRDYDMILNEQAEQLLGMVDALGKRACKIGGTTLRSVAHVARLQRIKDNDADFVAPGDMLSELRADNEQLAVSLREAQDLCNKHGDVASARLIESWIDDAKGRIWFFHEVTRRPTPPEN